MFGQSPHDFDESAFAMNQPLATVLAFAPKTPAGRQRAIAAIGGVAALALVLVGVTSGAPHGTGSGGNQQALAPSSERGGPKLPGVDAPPLSAGVRTGIPGHLAAADRLTRGASGHAGGATGNDVHGSFSVFNGAATGNTSRSGASSSPSGGTSVAPSLPSAPTTSASNAVTQLTSSTGDPLSTIAQQKNAISPGIVPSNSVVSNVGTTVSGLTGTLAAPNA
jgi:hypothetical protein